MRAYTPSRETLQIKRDLEKADVIHKVQFYITRTGSGVRRAYLLVTFEPGWHSPYDPRRTEQYSLSAARDLRDFIKESKPTVTRAADGTVVSCD